MLSEKLNMSRTKTDMTHIKTIICLGPELLMDPFTRVMLIVKLRNCFGGEVLVPTEAQLPEMLVQETPKLLYTLIHTLMKDDR